MDLGTCRQLVDFEKTWVVLCKQWGCQARFGTFFPVAAASIGLALLCRGCPQSRTLNLSS